MPTTTVTRNDEIYSDFKANLDPHPNQRDVVKITNEDAIIRSVRNILLTDRFERFGNPTFGSGLKALLFEPVSRMTAEMIKDNIIEAIENFEPRANLLEVIVEDRSDLNGYAASISFGVSNNIDPVNITLLLERIR